MEAGDWDARYAQTEMRWSVEPNASLVDEVADLAPGRALDVACGEGRNAIWLAERGWQVTAVDFSPVAVGRARRLADARGVGVCWVVADVVVHRPQRQAFDLVAVTYLHLPRQQLQRVLLRAVAALTPGGILVLVGHDLANLEGGRVGPKDPQLLWTPAGIAALLGGLQVERAERVSRPASVEGPQVEAVDTLVRARR